MTERFPRKKALALHKVHVKTEENGGREKVFLPQHQLFDFNIILAKKFGPLKLQSVQFCALDRKSSPWLLEFHSDFCQNI